LWSFPLTSLPAHKISKVELRDIVKRFPGVIANDHINFDVKAGEVHALLGENGAGKTTLMRILYGLYQPDEGQILIDNKPVTIDPPWPWDDPPTLHARPHAIGRCECGFGTTFQPRAAA
jgi:ABC-type branched-subunit amino acid transport system ATPase component